MRITFSFPHRHVFQRVKWSVLHVARSLPHKPKDYFECRKFELNTAQKMTSTVRQNMAYGWDLDFLYLVRYFKCFCHAVVAQHDRKSWTGFHYSYNYCFSACDSSGSFSVILTGPIWANQRALLCLYRLRNIVRFIFFSIWSAVNQSLSKKIGRLTSAPVMVSSEQYFGCNQKLPQSHLQL